MCGNPPENFWENAHFRWCVSGLQIHVFRVVFLDNSPSRTHNRKDFHTKSNLVYEFFFGRWGKVPSLNTGNDGLVESPRPFRFPQAQYGLLAKLRGPLVTPLHNATFRIAFPQYCRRFRMWIFHAKSVCSHQLFRRREITCYRHKNVQITALRISQNPLESAGYCVPHEAQRT